MKQFDVKNWDEFKQNIKDEVDDYLILQFSLGLVIGERRRKVTRDQARDICPERSSLNPTRIWGWTRSWADGHTGTMLEALETYLMALIPAAEMALIDQRGQLLPNGNTCQWPPSPLAAQYLQWSKANARCIQKCIDEKIYNLGFDKSIGLSLWDIGEVAEAICLCRIPVKKEYKGRRPILHYYPEKNWKD